MALVYLRIVQYNDRRVIRGEKRHMKDALCFRLNVNPYTSFGYKFAEMPKGVELRLLVEFIGRPVGDKIRRLIKQFVFRYLNILRKTSNHLTD